MYMYMHVRIHVTVPASAITGAGKIDRNISVIFCVTDWNDFTFDDKNFPATSVACASIFPWTFCCLSVSCSSTFCLWWKVAICKTRTDSFNTFNCCDKYIILSMMIKLKRCAVMLSATDGWGSAKKVTSFLWIHLDGLWPEQYNASTSTSAYYKKTHGDMVNKKKGKDKK